MVKFKKKIYKHLAILILIGGKSKRFGSDKGIYEFLGKPLISYQLETLKDFKNDIFLVANSIKQVQTYINKIDINQITAFIIDDYNNVLNKELSSPMIGLYSGFKELEKLGYIKTLVLSCDLPLISYKVIKYLIEISEKYDCSIPKWNNGFIEPLFAVYPIKKGLSQLNKNLKRKKFKLTDILSKKWKINYISIENSIQILDKELNSFININELKDIKQLIGKK